MKENKINIAELLKDCPKGTKLYSPLCGECYFDSLNMGTIICKKQNTQEITFTSGGYYMLPVFDDCECQLFPSKDQRDWSKFEPPYEFKDGDVVATNSGCFIGIIEIKNNMQVGTYCAIDYRDDFKVNPDYVFSRLATEKEKQKLFDAIKDNGYHWDAETKILKKLPKFKVGDKIRHKINNKDIIYEISAVYNGFYGLVDYAFMLDMKYQDDYELVPTKFDINTLVPFESRVLVRNGDRDHWRPAIFGGYAKNKDNEIEYYYALGGTCWRNCIPYEGNEHLRGTTDDCKEFYKT